MSIFLIRHGETASNAARIVQVPETPLNERGIAQADRLAARLSDRGIRLILSSDLERARMTAARLAAVLDVPVAYDAGLQERNYGDLRGRAYQELDFNIHAPGFAPPGGEEPSWLERITSAINTWMQRSDLPVYKEIGGANGKAKRGLAWRPRHPTYRDGLLAIARRNGARSEPLGAP